MRQAAALAVIVLAALGCGGSSTTAPSGPTATQATFASVPAATEAPIATVVGSISPCLPPPTGVVAWWRGDGDATDSTGTNDGALEGGTTFAPGMVGQAFSFDGTDDLVRVTTADDLNPDGSFSIEAWIYPTVGEGPILHKWGDVDDWDSHRTYALSLTAGAHLRFGIADDARQQDDSFHFVSAGGSGLPLDAWTHVAFTYEQAAGERRIYASGMNVASRTDTPADLTDGIADLLIGAYFASSTIDVDYFDGLIDEVLYFDRALSEDEVVASFTAGAAGYCRE